jgi:hypothetical protein
MRIRAFATPIRTLCWAIGTHCPSAIRQPLPWRLRMPRQKFRAESVGVDQFVDLFDIVQRIGVANSLCERFQCLAQLLQLPIGHHAHAGNGSCAVSKLPLRVNDYRDACSRACRQIPYATEQGIF